MARRNSLETRLPPILYGEVYALAKSGRPTINDLVFLVRSRGYVISSSAMHRFMQRVILASEEVERFTRGFVDLAEIAIVVPRVSENVRVLLSGLFAKSDVVGGGQEICAYKTPARR